MIKPNDDGIWLKISRTHLHNIFMLSTIGAWLLEYLQVATVSLDKQTSSTVVSTYITKEEPPRPGRRSALAPRNPKT